MASMGLGLGQHVFRHATFLEPLPPPLSGIGDLFFAPGLSAAAPLSDSQSYIVRPLQLSGPQSLVCSDSLDHLWDRLWSHPMGLCTSASGSQIGREALSLDDEQFVREHSNTSPLLR